MEQRTYVSLAIVCKPDFQTAQQIIDYIEKDLGVRIVYRKIAPQWERLWIEKEDPQERVELGAERGEAP